MVIDATEKFVDRFASTLLEATKKDGPIRAALRVSHLPSNLRVAIKEKMIEKKAQR